eukprot:s2085_g16.t1
MAPESQQGGVPVVGNASEAESSRRSQISGILTAFHVSESSSRCAAPEAVSHWDVGVRASRAQMSGGRTLLAKVKPMGRSRMMPKTAKVAAAPNEGDVVEAFWPDDEMWLEATVTQVFDDGSYRIAWAMDDSESDVPADYVRWPGEPDEGPRTSYFRSSAFDPQLRPAKRMKSTCDPPLGGDCESRTIEGDFGHFDKHRFDNYTDWLDRETRKRNRAQGQHIGFGFPVPKAPQAPRHERPFYVTEQSMVSGLMVRRKYDQTETSYATVATRSDPHHYPNHIDVKDADHYKDHGSRVPA